VRSVVVALPDRIQLVFLSVATALGIAVTLGVFRPLVVVPLIIVLTTLAWRWMPVGYARTRNSFLGAIGAIGVALVWVLGNIPFASQLLEVRRDPGIYTVTGIWLIDNPSPTIPVDRAIEITEGLTHASGDLGLFHALPSGVVQLQGGDLLPAFMGAFGWIGGIPAALFANVVIGGVALIALYALARRVVGPIWALLPIVVLGFGMPMMYLSRAPYSEIIMLVVGVAGLIWLMSAIKRGRITDWAVAGAFFGVAGFTRADGPIGMFGVQAALIVLSFGFIAVDKRAQFARGTLVFSVVAIVFLAAGLADLAIHKPWYLGYQIVEIALLWAGLLVITTLSIVLWRFAARRPEIANASQRRFAIGAASIVGVILAFWLSRPLWMTNHFQRGTGHQAVRNLQRFEGSPIDDSRSYEEYTFDWIGWYFGPPLLITAAVGMVILVFVAVRQRRYGLLMIAAVTLATAALYFTRVNITPDQPWAYRRILPLITPGFFIAATYALYRLWHLDRVWKIGRRWWKALAALLAVSFLVAPLLVANSLVLTRDGDQQLREASAICDEIEGDTVILDNGGAPYSYALTLRTVCGVDVVSVSAGITQQELVTIIDRIGGPTSAVVFAEGVIPGGETLPEPLVKTRASFWTPQLLKTPQGPSYNNREAWVGTVGTDGLFSIDK
jgi:hypothetical protein